MGWREDVTAALLVLILNHAGPDVWQGIEKVTLVEEWHDGEKLVPVDWRQ